MGRKDQVPSLVPLQKTLEVLKEIRSALLPFLDLLREHHKRHQPSDRETPNEPESKKKRCQPTTPCNDSHRRAEAEAAVALAISTLRYMGARLRGMDQGRKIGDPLRKELDKIRGLLVALQRIDKEKADERSELTADKVSKVKPMDAFSDRKGTDDDSNAIVKRRRIVDTDRCHR